MQTPPWLASIAHVILVFAIPVIMVVTPLLVYVSPTWVRYQYGRTGFPPSSRFTLAERLRISDVILHYLHGRATLEQMAAAKTDGGEIALNEDEVQHLVDVKGVTDGFFRAYAVALVLALLCIAALWRSSQRERLPAALRQGVWIICGLMLLILASSLIDFDVFFTRFHQLFFQPGTWVFYVEDTLIQLYPLPFWIDTVWKLAITIMVEGLLVYGAAAGLSRYLSQS
ncbi:MAG: TIGR01906 family membrane protein [Chloroflexi bacterium]|nr:TIGR01906 family membrane protein [Chloroflexota bacterium]